jgi:hypothetical protein
MSLEHSAAFIFRYDIRNYSAAGASAECVLGKEKARAIK